MFDIKKYPKAIFNVLIISCSVNLQIIIKNIQGKQISCMCDGVSWASANLSRSWKSTQGWQANDSTCLARKKAATNLKLIFQYNLWPYLQRSRYGVLRLIVIRSIDCQAEKTPQRRKRFAIWKNRMHYTYCCGLGIHFLSLNFFSRNVDCQIY